MDKEGRQILKNTFNAIEKQHGSGTVFRLGSTRRMAVTAIPTGCLAIDLASGVGGLPRGRIVEVFGPPSGGKTTLTLMAIAEVHKNNGMAAFIDAEHALDPEYAKSLGVDTDNLIVSQPDNGEQALEVTEALVKSGQLDIIVVDSVAALVPKAELDGEMGQAQMGLQARLMSQAMRKLTVAVSRSKTCLVFINQIRMKIGVIYGNPETTTGGEALKFYSSMRITVRPGKHIKVGANDIGTQTKIKFIKNKVATPYKEAEVDQMYGKGFDGPTNLLTPALKLGVLHKSGSHIYFGDDAVANGEDAFIEAVSNNPLMFAAIDDACREVAFKVAPPAPSDVDLDPQAANTLDVTGHEVAKAAPQLTPGEIPLNETDEQGEPE